MAFNMKAAIAAAKGKVDMTQTTGGGDFELPVEGFVRLRFIGYIETGKKETTFKGQKKVNDTAELIFELSGPKHAPRDTDNGKVPMRVTERVKLSLNEKSNFTKLFTAMNWEGKATHIAELLGEAYVGRIEHNKVKGADGNDFTYVNIRDVRKPFATNPETGDEYKLEVDPPLSEQRLHLWDFCSREMWDSLYIAGEYEARTNDKGEVTSPARSKNVIQEKIMKALNWKSHPMYEQVKGGVTNDDAAALEDAVGDSEQAAVQQDADDLEGIA